MHTISLSEFITHISTYMELAQKATIFIYPTDTIYGIGAIVSPQTIQKITRAKLRQAGKHYSIIAPSFKRIQQHFDVSKNIENERNDRSSAFPGRGLTLVLPLKNQATSSNLSILNSQSSNLIGVRYLGDHPIQRFVTELGQAFITTSCNIGGQDHITSIDQIPDILKKNIDITIDAGSLSGKPSVIIEYVSGELIRS